ncbi:MAG: group 1 glycosyl transferase, partial [Xenococcus sp. (in: cyanobacteria)]
MKLAYVTTYDPSNLRAWSGLGYYILKALQNSGFETTNIGNLKSSKMSRFISKVKNAYYNK